MELLITVLFPRSRCWETVFACHKLSETSLCLQSHQQLLLPWGQAIEMICLWLSEWCTLPERTRPAAPSCVCRYVAISSIRLGRVAVGRVCGTFGPALLRAARTTASSPHQRLLLFIWREAARSGIYLYIYFFSVAACERMIPACSCFILWSTKKNLSFHVAFVTGWTVIAHVSHRRLSGCQRLPVCSTGSSRLHFSQEVKY